MTLRKRRMYQFQYGNRCIEILNLVSCSHITKAKVNKGQEKLQKQNKSDNFNKFSFHCGLIVVFLPFVTDTS